jgi:hypothetical protein
MYFTESRLVFLGNCHHHHLQRIGQARTSMNDVRFGVFTAVTMRNAVLWDI